MNNEDRVRIGYLVGTSHCGSTLMGILMDLHPDMACVGEPGPNRRRLRENQGNLPCSCGQPVGDCKFWTEVFDVVERSGLQMGAEAGGLKF